jgi:mannose-6-phosphate isomerase-like protein (cupin superfamily)
MLLTGVVLGQLYRLDSPGAATIPAANPLALQTAERFYAAVNSLLETGDPSALRGTLHDRFVDRASDHESPASAGELEDQLLALRQSLPGIRVAASTITVQHSIVASTITFSGMTEQITESLTAGFAMTPTGYELLEIDGSKVIERWSGPAFSVPAEFETLGSTEVAGTPSFKLVDLSRLTIERFARYTVDNHDGTILIVESGSLAVAVASPETPATAAALTAGQRLEVPANTPFSLANTELEPASALLLTISVPNGGAATATFALPRELEHGVSRDVLASGSGFRPGADRTQVTMSSVQLAPGATIAAHRVAEFEMLVVAEGALDADVRDGDIGVFTEMGTVTRQSGLISLTAGQGIAVDPGAEVSYRVTGQAPATIWLVTAAPMP